MTAGRALYDFMWFEMNLNFLSTAITAASSAANLHCLPFEGSSVSFEFTSLDVTSLSAVKLKAAALSFTALKEVTSKLVNSNETDEPSKGKQ